MMKKLWYFSMLTIISIGCLILLFQNKRVELLAVFGLALMIAFPIGLLIDVVEG